MQKVTAAPELQNHVDGTWTAAQTEGFRRGDKPLQKHYGDPIS
jgi:hypothetical protein